MTNQVLYRVAMTTNPSTHFVRHPAGGEMQVINTQGLGAEPMPPALPLGKAELLRREASDWWRPFRFQLVEAEA
jgi:hypothetical protein